MNRASVLLSLLASSLIAGCSVEPAADKTVEDPGPVPEDTGASGGEALSFCAGATAHRWDRTATEDADLFPDGLYEVDDPSSPTGRRLAFTAETVPWLASAPALLKEGFEALDGMSGFGTLGGILLRFHAPVTAVPTGAAATLDDPGWMLVELGEDGPVRVPFEAEVQEDGLTVVAWPLVPLKLGTPHAFVVTTEALAADGDCIAPAAATQALLSGEVPAGAPADAADRTLAAVDQLGLAPDDISVISVFTTHDETGDFRALAEVARDEPVSWLGTPDCTENEATGLRQCDVTITVLDRRNAAGMVDASVTPVEGEIPVRIWTPLEGEGPWPVVFYGHGLGSRRSEARYVAEAQTGSGYAVVAMEAVLHGDHPTSAGGATSDTVLSFLGLDITSVKLNAQALRGNFEQTVLDRVRLLSLIRQDGDFDGDGVADLDGENVGYLGVSLGAILAPQLLAVTPELQGAVLSVGGGRLLSIVTDTSSLSEFEDILGALVGSKERFDRLVPLAQHVVDPTDSALWGAHVIDDRFDDALPPSVMLHVAMYDEVVPKTSGHALARAMRLPHLGPVAEPVDTLEVVDASPLAGNLGDDRTAAFFQFDRVTDRGRVVPATHVETPTSPEGTLQMMTFLETWLDGGAPEAIDPYAELGTPEG